MAFVPPPSRLKYDKKKYFSIIDGIIAGEGEGPLEPTSKKTGILAGGFNPVSVDFIAIKLMGFDYKKIPIIRNSFSIKKYKLFNKGPNRIRLISKLDKKKLNAFKPPKGWTGYIEL